MRLNQCRDPQEIFARWAYTIHRGHFPIFGLEFKKFKVLKLHKNGLPSKSQTRIGREAREGGHSTYTCWTYPTPLLSEFSESDIFARRDNENLYAQVISEDVNDNTIMVQFGEFGQPPQKTEKLSRLKFLSILKKGK